MTTTRSGNLTEAEAAALSADEIREMSPEEAMIAGAAADGIYIVHRRNRFPVPGTKAESRLERVVALCFLISALAGFGFIVAFIAIPFKWHLRVRRRISASTRPPSAGCLRSCCCSSVSAWCCGPAG